MQAAAPGAVLESSTDSLAELTEKYQVGQWAVVNLTSLESIPFSDFSHTPYSEASHFLDTQSNFSIRPGARPLTTGTGVVVSPMDGSVNLARRGTWQTPESNGNALKPSPSTSLPSLASRKDVKNPPPYKPTRESKHVIETLVRRELNKPAPDAPNDKDLTRLSNSDQLKPKDVTPLRQAVALHDSLASSPDTAAAEAATKLRSSQGVPRRLPVPPRLTVRRVQPPPTNASGTIPSPLEPQSLRELTNARRIVPIGAAIGEGEVEEEAAARSPSRQSELSVSGEDSSPRRKVPNRRSTQWMHTARRIPAAPVPPLQKVVAHATPSELDSPPTVRVSRVQQSINLVKPTPTPAFVAEVAASGGGDTVNLGSISTDSLVPSQAPFVRRASRTDSHHLRSVPTPVKSDKDDDDEDTMVVVVEVTRKPLSLPPPPLPPAGLAEDQSISVSSYAMCVSPRDALATASAEQLVAFVREVSDTEVLHVIYDYMTEHKDGRKYLEATRVCAELLQRKESLLAGGGGAQRRSRAASGRSRHGRAILSDDDERQDAVASSASATQAFRADSPLDDEFGDLNFRDDSYPTDTGGYQFGEPTVLGQVSPVFQEGMLFKIKDAKGDYYFYNDTLNQVMMVRAQCLLKGNERINERAILTPVEGLGSVTEVTIAVLPEETNFFMGGCKRLPRVMARAVVTPADFTPPSLTCFLKHMNAEINLVRAGLGQWSKATDQKAYLQCCLRKRLKFTDLDFRPSASSLYRSAVDCVKVPALTWRRPCEYLALTEVSEARLFRGEISCHLVGQGELSNNTVMAAIAAVAQYPHHVMWMFRHPTNGETGKKERAVGCYRVSLLKNGWWVNCVVDDYLPASVKGPLFAHCPVDPRRLWVPLLEKAFAKASGSYSAACLAGALEALTDFTGYPSQSFIEQWRQAQQGQPTASAAALLFRYLRRCVASGYLVLLHTPPASDAEAAAEVMDLSRKRAARARPDAGGVVLQFLPGHIYFLVEAAHYRELDLRMVRLKNPWTAVTAEQAASAPSSLNKKWKYTGWYQRPDENYAATIAAVQNGSSSVTNSARGVLPSVASSGSRASSAAGQIRTLEAQALDVNERRRGTMWLEWTEALRVFSGGGVCYTLWHAQHYRVRNHFDTGIPEFIVEVAPISRRVELMVTLTVEDLPGTADGEGSAHIASTVPSSPARKKRTTEAIGPCGVTMAVTRRATGGWPTEEVCHYACENLETFAAQATYVHAKSVSMKLTLDPSTGPYHIFPRMDPADARALARSGESRLPFALGILSSHPVDPRDLTISFKRISRSCPLYTTEAPFFALADSAPGPFSATYQCCHDRGFSIQHGTSIVPER